MITNNCVLEKIVKQPSGGLHEVWLGKIGYDTRPRANGRALPVGYVVGFGDSQTTVPQGEKVPQNDVWSALLNIQCGHEIALPNYSNGTKKGEILFVRTNDGWIESYINQ